MDYTIHDTPAIRTRIARDLDLVVATVRDGDPALRSLVLTGGFARGEGTVHRGEPQNDYDVVAIRGLGRPRVPYARMAADLGAALGLHVDLARVAAVRLPWVASSIFWYETALRGRVLHGEDLLGRIRIRAAADLDPAEGLRLLANRAAGLLLVGADADPHAVRIQAAKAFLAALDAHLLARGDFAPSQRERWELFDALRERDETSPLLERIHPALAWAFQFKTEPALAPDADAAAMWRGAARALLDAVPAALRCAGLSSLEAYGQTGGLLERAVFFARGAAVTGGNRLARHPAGRVRTGTLRLLEAALEGRSSSPASTFFGDLVGSDVAPLRALSELRRLTLT